MGCGHVIRLGSAWEGGPAADGTVAWVRRFGRPTGLAAGDAVWLVIEEPAACGLRLNAAPLPAAVGGGTYRVEVTRWLAPRNLLVLEPAGPAAAAGTAGRVPLPAALGDVRLEIVPAAEAG